MPPGLVLGSLGFSVAQVVACLALPAIAGHGRSLEGVPILPSEGGAVKNFPHQYNRFSLLRRTLATIADLNRAGSNVADDGVLGYQLARRGVYTFRALQGNLEDRIRAEQRKPEGSQGARTAAREIRRTLRYLDFLDNGLQVTPAGEQLLKSAEGSPEERAIWQVALMNMPLDDQGDVSHPVRILLRLVEHSGQLAREEMALALEARDDSDAEFQRILGLVPVRQAIQAGTLNTTKYQADNAVKILPSFAEQAGLIVRPDPFSPYTLTAAGQTALGAGLATGPVAVRPQPAPPRQARPAQGGVQTLPADPRMPAAATSIAALSPEEQAAAARLRFERTARHQMLLGKVAD